MYIFLATFLATAVNAPQSSEAISPLSGVHKIISSTNFDLYYTFYSGMPEFNGPDRPPVNRTHVYHVSSTGDADYHVNKFSADSDGQPDIQKTRTWSVDPIQLILLTSALAVEGILSLPEVMQTETVIADDAVSLFEIRTPDIRKIIAGSHLLVHEHPLLKPIISIMETK